MRIAVTYWTRRRVGGTESYLESIIPQLLAVGHEVGFWYEVDEPADRPLIELPPSVPVWCVSENGADEALRRLREWQPDVIYGQSLADPQLELETLKIAPGILFAHAYYGSCISGSKSFQRPTTRPCDRQFGWQCLVNYYPRRCGGLSPLTMIGEYRKQQSRRSLLSKYRFVVTHSTHMRDEYIRQGCEPARVQCLSYYAHKTSQNPEMVTTQPEHHSITCSQRKSEIENAAQAEWRLLFLGRMEKLKGGQVLIDALAHVVAALDRPVRMVFAGDGPARPLWEKRAAEIAEGNLTIEFAGWVTGSLREALLSSTSLLVLPSLWPEPFGLVGPEAGLRAVPTAAFAVGGITDWLKDGVNGHLADGNPPTAAGLADAIIKCLRDSATQRRLAQGALMMSREFNLRNHLKRLLPILERTANEGAAQINVA